MWTKESLQETIKTKLSGRQLIVASNREPYIHEYAGRKIKCVRAISGMTTALDPVLRACGGVWIAWGSGDADRQTVDARNCVRVPPHDPKYTLKRIWLTKQEEEGYYYGYSNQAIWPLCHIAYRQPVFNAQDFEYYRTVNQRFAEAILEELNAKPAFVWLHDYQLALCAKFIKEKAPDVTTALFWHTPWPNPEAFRICPQKKEILEGLLSNELLGFHILYHCQNFLRTCEMELEAQVVWEDMSITYRGHKTFVRPFPISIDAAAWSQLAASPQVEEALKALPTEIDPPYEILAVGLDRIDYIKGIIEKLKAIDRFLEKYPQYKGRFVFLQSLAPSRLHLKPYKQVIDEVQSLKEEINWKHGVGNWYPVVLIVQHLDYGSPKHLALLRAADLFIVGSLHDGMNLVAKEFVMANVEQKGVLILSQWTGSARELKEAVLINPYDTDGFADAIAYAIEMSEAERRERIQRMQQTILENNIYRWAGTFIEELVKLK